ncbi:MAG: hypothetical protein H6745_28145 [Deltaproteobacteria bacterium]|nr:hypothetical protein [Deltaproteobacteria bacterium]
MGEDRATGEAGAGGGAERRVYQLDIGFGLKIPVELGDKRLEWRQGVRRFSVPWAAIAAFGLRVLPKVLGQSQSQLVIVCRPTAGVKERYRIPADPDKAETQALVEALAARLPHADARAMPAAAAEAVVGRPGFAADVLNTRTLIGICVLAAAAAAAAVSAGAARAGETGAFRMGYAAGQALVVVGGLWLVVSGILKARRARRERAAAPGARREE